MSHSRRTPTAARLRLLALEDRTVPSSFHLIATGSDVGAAPVVNVYNANSHALLASITAYDRKFPGGARVATADLNRDGADEIVTGAGPGGGPHVQAFKADGSVMTSFYAYAPTFTGGVSVAAGVATNTSTNRDIVTGSGPGGLPTVN